MFRGWVLALLIAWTIASMGPQPSPPHILITPVSVVVLVVCVVGSVQAGRRTWARPGSRAAIAVANGVLVLAAPLLVGTTVAQFNNAVFAYEALSNPYVQEGITVNGKYVTNVFAYDAEGKPLEDVQLYDQDGDPIIVVGDPQATYLPSADGLLLLVPNDHVLGRPGWNVFPLEAVPQESLDPLGDVDASDARRATPPYDAVAPLEGTATDDDAARPSPSSTPSPLAER